DSQLENTSRQSTLLHVLQRHVEIFQLVVVRDQLVDLELAAEIELGEHGEVTPRLRRAVTATVDRLVLIERVHDELESRADLGYADNGQRPARAECLER